MRVTRLSTTPVKGLALHHPISIRVDETGAVGDRLFWDGTNKVVNKTATAQVCVGVAVSAAANPSSTVSMKLGAVTSAGT